MDDIKIRVFVSEDLLEKIERFTYGNYRIILSRDFHIGPYDIPIKPAKFIAFIIDRVWIDYKAVQNDVDLSAFTKSFMVDIGSFKKTILEQQIKEFYPAKYKRSNRLYSRSICLNDAVYDFMDRVLIAHEEYHGKHISRLYKSPYVIREAAAYEKTFEPGSEETVVLGTKIGY